MNIDTYLRNIDTKTFAPSLSLYQSATHWLHNHPTVTKTAKVALYVLGAGLVVGGVTALTAGHAALAVIGGGVLIGSTWLASKIFSTVISPHNMSNHKFTPKKIEGGELYYDGDVPILNITEKDPFKAGQVHGYLIADVLSKLRTGWDLALHRLAGVARPSQVPDLIASLRKEIPDEYIKEMDGIVKGYNRWVDENKAGTKLSTDDLIFYHLLPDSTHFELPTSHNIISKIFSPIVGLACTAIVDHDEKKGPIFARNMDWPSLGVAGASTLVIKRAGGTCDVGLPGFVGTLTGMNTKSGLSVAMNVCQNKNQSLGSEIRGMPSSLFNRFVLDTCQSVKDVENLLKHEKPLGPYHMTVADATEAKAFHMYQGEGENPHTIRSLNKDEPLIVTNCRYSDSGQQSCHLHYSNERAKTITGLFKKVQDELDPQLIDKEKILDYSLSLPHVNNYETTHKILMIPKTKTFKVAFNNEYAGQDQLHTVTIPQP